MGRIVRSTGVSVDFDATVGQEAAKALAVSGDVGQGLAER
jgi:hypothetical protein